MEVIMKILFCFLSLSTTVIISGCGPATFMGAPTEHLTQRASFDLNCPESQINVVDLGGKTKGVTGCGKKATYVETCTGQKGEFATTCSWVLNSTADLSDEAEGAGSKNVK
jgi:hypothetical protein